MFLQKAKGKYYDMGQENGKNFLIGLKEFQDQGKLDFFPKKVNDEQIKLARKFEKEMQKYCPDILEEMRGFTDGAGLDFIHHLAQECTPVRLQSQCMIIAISGEHTEDGDPIFLKNQEWLETDGEYLTVCTSKPKDNLNSIGMSFFTANTSRYGGINEAGLAISSVSAGFSFKEPGVMFNAAIRWILDNCSTTKEAVNYLEKIPKVWGSVFVIIDKKGIIAKVESHYEKTLVTYSNNGFEMVTFRFDSPEMIQYNDNDATLDLHDIREKRVNEWFNLNQGNITEQMLIDIAGEHESQICTHIQEGDNLYGTCWSYILSGAKNYALVSEGPPCKKEYQKLEFDLRE